MKTPDLKPCPFCGGKAKQDEFYDECYLTAWSVFCDYCGAEIKSIAGIENAIEAWNRRASDENA